MSETQYLGDGVFAEYARGAIVLRGGMLNRENVIYLDPQVYQALRRWARANGYEPNTEDHSA